MKKITDKQKLKKLKHRLVTAKGMLTFALPARMSDDAYELVQRTMPGSLITVTTYSVPLRNGKFEDRVKYTVVK